MFGARWRLFRLLGIPIYIDLSWLVILVLVTFFLTNNFAAEVHGYTTYEYVGMGLVTALAYFTCILLHELGHATVARATGLPIRGITLFIFGGVAELSEEPRSAGGEFVMAIAGPAVSAVLGGLFLALYALGFQLGWPEAVLAVFRWLGWINLILLGFNMIPGFPLDGGRVLRSILWGATGNLRRATWWASLGGRAFAWFLIAWGLLIVFTPFFSPEANGSRGLNWGGLWLIFIGWFVNNAAKGSYRQVLVKQALGGEPVRRFMNPQPVVVPPTTNLRHFVEDYVYHLHRKAFPVGEDGRLEGYVSTRMLGQYPREEWGGHTIADVMELDWKARSVAPDDDALKVLSKMQRTGLSRLLVVEGEKLVGIVSLKDLMRFLHLKLELGDGDGDGTKSGAPAAGSHNPQ